MLLVRLKIEHCSFKRNESFEVNMKELFLINNCKNDLTRSQNKSNKRW